LKNGTTFLCGSWSKFEADNRPKPVGVYIEMRWTSSAGSITLDQAITNEFLSTEEAFANNYFEVDIMGDFKDRLI